MQWSSCNNSSPPLHGPMPCKLLTSHTDKLPSLGLWWCVLREQWAMATMTVKSYLIFPFLCLLETKTETVILTFPSQLEILIHLRVEQRS